MNPVLFNILILTLTLGVSAFLSVKFVLKGQHVDVKKNDSLAAELLEKSQNEANEISTQTKNYVQKKREEIAQYVEKKEERILKLEQSLTRKEELLNSREGRNKELKLSLAKEQEELQGMRDSLKRVDIQILETLAKKNEKTPLQVRDEIIEKEEKQLELENSERLARMEEVLKENAEKTARRIIIDVIQRLCTTSSVETRAVNIEVQNDLIKGKIVGREGVNIRAFEELLNVDIVFNDLPNTISISAFSLVERRIAQVAMEHLVRMRHEITPEIVKKTIEKATEETDKELYKIGKEALEKIGIKHDNEEFIRTVGRLRYRTSYGQNILKHSLEVGWACRMLGNEIGLDEKTCLVAGFLHDIGKAIDQDPKVKDCHDRLSKEIMEKHGFSWEEVHAAWVHHDAEPQQTPEALLVKAADAISASRPGARQESFEKYIERIKELESLAISHEGVKRAFAISAGREVRVIVDPDKVGDQKSQKLATEIAHQIEEEVTYPGQIKVNVIRRTKHTEIAK